MGRASIESIVWTDGRLNLLAKKMGWNKYETLGVMVRIWGCSQDREVTHCTVELLESWLDFYDRTDVQKLAEMCCEAQFFDREDEENFHIRGNKKHILAKKSYRENAKKAGKESGRKRRETKRKTVEPNGSTDRSTKTEHIVEPNTILYSSILSSTTQNNTELINPSDPPLQGGSIPVEIVPEKKLKPSTKIKTPPDASFVWEAYSEAYAKKYGPEPVRNAKMNGLCSHLVTRLGKEAAVEVVRFYLTHNDRYYVARCHDLSVCVANAEKLHTEWRKGAYMSSTIAKTTEVASNNQRVADIYLSKKNRL